MQRKQDVKMIQTNAYTNKTQFATGNVAPNIEVGDANKASGNHFQLSREIRANFALLEEMGLRKQFLLKEIHGVVKKS